MITETLLTLIARFISGASVRWVESQPDTCQRVYFANHTSHLDAVVLWSALPRNLRAITRPVAAADYWSKGWFRPKLAEAFNALLIDRQEIKVHHSPIDPNQADDLLLDRWIVCLPNGVSVEVTGAEGVK